jgi:N-sulfoglucosamine sulfohydrolase
MKNVIILCFITLTYIPSSFAKGKSRVKNPPNILVFIADDCTFRDIGCYGSIDSKTPNIDSFAKEGMQFSKCYQAVAMCSPTRSNLYTGLYPVKSGAYPNHTFVKEGVKSIVQYLSPAGYSTALLGKSHVSPISAFPFQYLGDNGDELDFQKMEDFLNNSKTDKNPFCLFVCSHQPHSPYTQGNPQIFDAKRISLPPFYVDTQETRDEFVKYLAEVNYMDWEFGKCLELLKKYDLSDNTVVIFTSEQGNSFPFAKWTCYSSGLQTAFLVKWPGKIKQNSVSDAMVEYVDVVPTLMEITGLKAPKYLDGRSFLPVLLKKRDTHKEYVYGIQTTRGINLGSEYYGIRTVCSDSYRYIINLTPDVTFKNNTTDDENKSIVFNSWKQRARHDAFAQTLVNRYQHRPEAELYDIINDPFEMTNLVNNPQYSDIIKKMRKKLFKWMKEQGDHGQETEMDALNRTVKGRN